MKHTRLIFILLMLPAFTLVSCHSYKKIGALTLAATRNVDIKNEYVLLVKNVYGYGKSKRGEAFQTAIDNAVNQLPNGEFLQNIRVFVKKGEKKVKVEGDLWGTPSATKGHDTVRYVVGERVFYRKNSGKFKKGKVKAIYADQDMAIIKHGWHKSSVAFNRMGKRRNEKTKR